MAGRPVPTPPRPMETLPPGPQVGGLSQARSNAQKRWHCGSLLIASCVSAEFRPGEPWKGYPNIDPETDPYMTPGSVINSLSINTVRDTDHLRDRNNGNGLIHFTSLCLNVYEACVDLYRWIIKDGLLEKEAPLCAKK